MRKVSQKISVDEAVKWFRLKGEKNATVAVQTTSWQVFHIENATSSMLLNKNDDKKNEQAPGQIDLMCQNSDRNWLDRRRLDKSSWYLNTCSCFHL